MRHLDLFSGIGGFSLAAKWLWGKGHSPIFVENDPFCQLILTHHWPKADIYGDIREVDTTKWRGEIGLLTGGFPCQPFSNAGRRQGTKDSRFLWDETLRIIKESRPDFVLLENVAGLLTILEEERSEMAVKTTELFSGNSTTVRTHRSGRRILGRILREIRQAGYILPETFEGEPIIFCIPACAVGAPHRRDRIWIAAYSTDIFEKNIAEATDLCTAGSSDVADFDKRGNNCTPVFCGGLSKTVAQWQAGYGSAHIEELSWPSVAVQFCRMDDEISAKLDTSEKEVEDARLKALGNAIVPEVAYWLMYYLFYRLRKK